LSCSVCACVRVERHISQLSPFLFFCNVIRIRVLLPRLLFLLCRCGTVQRFFLHLPRVIENPVKVITSDGCVGAAADVVYKVWLAAGLYIFPALCLRRLPLYPSAVTCYGVCILRMLGHTENILAVSHIGYLSLASPKMSSHPNPLFPAFYSVL